MLERTFSVYRRLQTSVSDEQLMAAMANSLRSSVGGTLYPGGDGIRVVNGTTNVSFAFTADLTANFAITRPGPGVVDVSGQIEVQPNSTFWVCAVLGFFCLGFLWAVNVLYFVMDPRRAYQEALDRIYLADVKP